MFDKEISHDFELELIDGNVYRISVCVENEKLKGSIPFEIFTEKIIMQYDQQNEKLKEVRKAILMYSNRDDNLSSKIEFQSAGTKNGFVRVFAPKLHNTNMHYSNCVGVFIQIQKEVGHEDD
jgi:hypothetical protein